MEYNVRGSQLGVRMCVVYHMGPILIVNKAAFLPDRCKGYAMAHTNKSHIVHVNGINI